MDPEQFSLSADGEELGWVRQTNSVVNARTGDVIFADGTDRRVEFAGGGPRFTNFEAGTVPPDGFTRFYDAGRLVKAVPGRALGWLDPSRVLVVTYLASGLGGVVRTYETTHIYDAQGTQLGLARLPRELQADTYGGRSFYTMAPTRILNRSTIYDLTSGASVWTTRETASFSVASAGDVVYASGGRILVESP